METSGSRKSARIAQKERETDATSDDDSKSTEQGGWRRRRLGVGNEVEEDEDFIQGRCLSVVFRIDDQRPAESQFNEDDFLDSELSGDEEWRE